MPSAAALIRCQAVAYISPDLGDMWHHGYLVSPQWEGGLELDSASDCDNVYGATERCLRDYISVTRECSLWIRPPDILSVRAAERKWNKAKLYGSPLPEWPSLCFDYRQNFGFVPSATESREWRDMIADAQGSGLSERELEVV